MKSRIIRNFLRTNEDNLTLARLPTTLFDVFLWLNRRLILYLQRLSKFLAPFGQCKRALHRRNAKELTPTGLGIRSPIYRKA